MENGYVVVPAPVGPVVTTIPVAYQPTINNGVSYYTINGATYMSTPNGYQVVPQPTSVQAAPQQNAAPAQQVPQNAVIEQTTQGASPGNNQDSYKVNIPNSKGTYTPVTLKRAGTGFIGPQGEYYAEFPKIEQLKVMYAK